MFKLKLSVLFVLLMLLAVLSAFYAVEAQRDAARGDDTIDVQRAREQLQQNLRLMDLELHQAAQRLARGRLSAYLEVADQFRDELDRMEEEVYEAVPITQYPVGDKTGTRKRQGFVAQQSEFLDALTEALDGALTGAMGPQFWEEHDRAEFVEKHRSLLTVCAAGAASKDCPFRMSYFPLAAALADLEDEAGLTTDIDLALVADRDGVGLADASSPTWSHDEAFAERYPLVLETKEGKLVRDVVTHGSSDRYFFVVAAPITYGAMDRFLGTLIVGTEVDETFVQQQARTLGVDVTYLHGDRVIRSTMQERALRDLVEPGFDYSVPVAMTLDDERFVAASVPHTGNFSDDGLRTILSVDLKAALSGYDTIELVLILFGALMVLVGIAIIQILVQGYARQFERIDAGIHEVINGNYDYQFSFDMQDSLASSMAQSLNLMVAVLLGRPLPEEEWEEGWRDEELLIGRGNGNGSDGKRALPDAASLPSVAPERGAELMKEPAETYYRRLFAEYLDARRGTGESVDKISYPAFVQKLVRNERMLRERLSCRYIRFEVSVREGQVTLTPIPIR